MKRTNVQNIAIITFIAILLGVGGYLIYKKNYADGMATYTNAAYGVSFTYPRDYSLVERESTEAPGTIVIITEDPLDAPENGEGPTAITVAMYDDAPLPAGGKTSAETWIATSPHSNFAVSNMQQPGITQVAGQDARLYTWDGLYQGTTVVTTHSGNILMFTVTYDGQADMEKRQVFSDLMASVTLTEVGASETSLNDAPQEATLTGAYECLPHKNTDGPQTAECAFGIKTSDGTHYALDMSAVSPKLMNTEMGGTIQVTGTLVPIEQISTDMWNVYDIRGIMKVESFTKA